MENGNKKKKNYYFIANYDPNFFPKKLKIIDKQFIKKNRTICKIIYRNKLYELKEYFEDIDINYNHKDEIKIKLVFIHNIIDISNMFYNCGSLTSLSFNKEDEKSLHIPKYIIDIYCKFPNCNSVISFLDIS